MAKQRFVVYKAFNKQGIEQRQLLVAGGHLSIFPDRAWSQEDIHKTTEQLMSYHHGKITSVSGWKALAKSLGACHFQKVIYFN
ncbi:hypothetical protein vBAspATola_30 [Aeromonas phage vB_AspA_Tola]|nr:hypothetical protein vBAspATola_30 [Aeromonas phage vB_AspA_Tola]